MVPVSLYDEVEITGRKLGKNGKSGLIVTCDDPLVPPGRENLAYRAASLLLRAKGINAAVRIQITKAIPVGGGLGGGSSDAAATLVGLNNLFHLGCRRSELRLMAASLGADLPFFIYGHPARARGIGEQLTPVRSFPRLWIVIVYPGFPVSSRWVYQHLNSKLTKAIENTTLKFSLEDPQRLKRLLVNDLEKVTIRRYPEIALIKHKLREEGAAAVLMSGSGSSVFGIFAGEQTAREASQRLHRGGKNQMFVVHSLR